MHESVMEFVADEVTLLGLPMRSTLEVGSFNVNGSVRELFHGTYVGVDIREGPGVDIVFDGVTLPFADEAFNVVVSTEMLEHAEKPGAIFAEMVRVLAPGGYLLVTARGPGYPIHDYPHDFGIRFDVADFEAMIADAGLQRVTVVKDPQVSGTFMVACKR